MHTIKKLTTMPYAQAHVKINESGDVYLFSYTTCVAAIVEDWLEIYTLYSNTTRRHIGAFMKEYVRWPNGECGTYREAKDLYKSGYKLNIKTGEIEELLE